MNARDEVRETRRRPDPVRPETPEAPGWQLDPWGDGERYWDGEIWTRRTRALGEADTGATEPGTPEPADAMPPLVGPRDWDEAPDPDAADDERPMRSGLVRGMIWALAVAALVALVATTISFWVPRPRPAAELDVPQRSAMTSQAADCPALCYT